MSDLNKGNENIIDERTEDEIVSETYEADIAFAVQEATSVYKYDVV